MAGADAVGRFFAGFDIEIPRSVSRRRAALPKPHLGDAASGAGSRGALGARNNGQHRSNGARMPVLSAQCCRSATFDRRIAAADHSRETVGKSYRENRASGAAIAGLNDWNKRWVGPEGYKGMVARQLQEFKKMQQQRSERALAAADEDGRT